MHRLTSHLLDVRDDGYNDGTPPVVIIGAGPAGLTAAYELSKDGLPSVVLEADSMVGGIARTVNYKGYRFDIGGHRFFTKVSLVEKMWREVLGADFITRPRLSRIYYKSKFFRYPLDPVNGLIGLGVIEASRCAASFLLAKLFPQKPEDNFEAWVSNRFGRRLFQIFFKSYTEKVWGMPCREIGAEWAAQRIRGLSLTSVVLNALKPKRNSRDKQRIIKTLLHEFQYPRKGPGMMWEKTKEIVEARNSRVIFNAPVDRIRWEPGRVISVRAGGKEYEGAHFISSMPIRDLIRALDPAPPAYLDAAAADFKYRDFLTVALICKGADLFPDNWIYIHDPKVMVGRVQNFGNWSPEMVPYPGMSCLGLEYFCFEGDRLWTMPDEELQALGRREAAQLGLVSADAVLDAAVVRMPKAYPVYDGTYQRGLSAIREFLKTVPNLQLVGRNGMHRYNNQDHSMLTAILAARNTRGSNYDLWQVNADEEYSEQGGEITEDEIRALDASQPLVPRAISRVGVTGR
jgi:protoporphyrinogen oxidase